MSTGLLALLAALPIVAIFVLMVGFRWSATRANFKIKAYDPIFHKNPKLLDEKYDYIACCEVIEHFYNPKKEFALLKKLLLKGGRLYCMTEIYDQNIDFGSWYYKNDPTHVFIYQRKTIDWINTEFGFSDVNINGRLITFFN